MAKSQQAKNLSQPKQAAKRTSPSAASSTSRKVAKNQLFDTKAYAKKSPTPSNLSALTIQTIATALRNHALSLPGAHEDFPWGERVIKVNKKVFVFLGRDDAISFSVKLPVSAEIALSFTFASPTGYGLGKSGWVSITPPSPQALPIEMMTAWIDESYRAIAPKKLIAELDRGR